MKYNYIMCQYTHVAHCMRECAMPYVFMGWARTLHFMTVHSLLSIVPSSQYGSMLFMSNGNQ